MEAGICLAAANDKCFMARFLNVQLLILLFLLLFNVFLVIAMAGSRVIDPTLHYLDKPLKWREWLNWNVNSYLAVLGISTLQFWFGLRFRNFIVPLAIGLALWIVGLLFAVQFHPSKGHFFPHAQLTYSAFPEHKDLLLEIQWSAAGYMLLFLTLGFLDFRRRGR